MKAPQPIQSIGSFFFKKYISVIAVLLFCAPLHADITSSLVVRLLMDETTGLSAADATGNGHNASLVSFPGDDSQWTTGRVVGGLRFNADSLGSTVALIPEDPALDFSTVTTPQFTLSAWVRGNVTFPQTNGACLLGKGLGGQEQFILDVQDGSFRFVVRNSALVVSRIQVNQQFSPSPATMLNGSWQHVVATFDSTASTNGMKLYVNSQLIGQTNAPTNLFSPAHDVSLGNREGSGVSGYNLPLTGIMDEVRIYGRSLTSNDVRELYLDAGIAAPVLVVSPQDATKFAFDTTIFSAVFDGTVPFIYQWKKNGTNIPNGTNASFTLSNLQTNDAGNYSVSVTNSVGSANSSNAVLTVQPLPPDDVTTGLVGVWRFNEISGLTAADSSGSNNVGTLTAFPGDDSQWVSGRVNGGLAINPPGTGSYVAIPHSASLNFDSVQSYTVGGWVKVKSPATQLGGAGFIAKGTGGGGEQYVLDLSANRWRIVTRNGTGAATTCSALVAPTDNVWEHVAAVYDQPARTLRVYINGQLSNSVTNNNLATLRATTQEVSIGNRRSAAAAYNLPLTNSMVDDVRIYNRGLTASQIQSLYTNAPALLEIGLHPQSATKNERDALAFFTVSAGGTPPIFYQWQREGTNIPGATGSSLNLNYLTLADAGVYSVIVSNVVGPLLSSNATLTIIAISPADTTNDLIARWTFDETSGTTAADSSGNGNTATLFNFPGDNSQWQSGVIGGALHFNLNGINNFVVTDNPISNFTNTDNFTFSFWAKRDTGTQGTKPRMITPATTHWVLWQPNVGVGFNNPPSGGDISSNAWQHFAVAFNRPANLYTVYVNAIRTAADAAPNNPANKAALSSSVQWVMGHSENLASHVDSFRGLFDDMRIYNRTFTINDVEALYEDANISPPIQVSRNGNMVTLSWPSWASHFVPQATEALLSSGTTWTNLSGTPSLNGITFATTETLGTTTKYYRLRRP